MNVVGRKSIKWSGGLCSGVLAVVLWGLPGVAAAGVGDGEGEDGGEKAVPGKELSELASNAVETCQLVEKIKLADPSTYPAGLVPRKPDTTGMSRAAKQEADRKYEALLEIVKNDLDTKIPNVAYQCSDVCGADDTKVNLCALASPSLAAIAVLLAPDEARIAVGRLEEIVTPIETIEGKARPAEEGPKRTPAAAVAPGVSLIASALGLGSGSTSEFAAGLAKALAEFVLERAKREALSYVLDQMNKDLCPAKENTQWFPHLCALAKDDRLGSYAAGAALLEALQGALLEDARSWPGIMVGSAPQARLEKAEELAALPAIQASAGRAFDRIARGNNPAVALYGLGTEFYALKIEQFRVHGCGLALPAAFLTYLELLDGLDAPEPAAMLATLVGIPECSELVAAPNSQDQTFPNIHKLVTVWNDHKHELRQSTVTGAALVAAQREYNEAMAAQPSAEQPKQEPKKDGEKKDEDGDKNDEKKKAEKKAEPKPDPLIVRRQTATVALYGSAIEFTRSNIVVLKLVIDPKHETAIKPFETDLETFEKVAKVLDAQLNERWGEAVALLARHIDETCSTTDPVCNSTIKRLGTIAAMLAAGDDGKKIENVLKATAHPPGGWRSKAKPLKFTLSVTAFVGLSTAAEWRWGSYGAVVEQGGVYWQRPTLAMPIGLDFAWGNCKGVGDGEGTCACKSKDEKRKEKCECRKTKRGVTAYGFFLSVIDPAAFLGYDSTGKLPGPRLTTVFSPGASIRVTPPRTPFALLFYAVYRPQYRTWEATLDGPGASVVQVGLNLAVDVTLWTIMSRGKNKR